jgi:C-terminal binding protein
MSNKPIVLLLADTDEVIEKEILQDKAEIIKCPDFDKVTSQQWGCVQAIITSHLFNIDRSLQERCPQLRVVARLGIGVDNIDVDCASELGVCVCNVPDYGIEEVADTAFAHLLGLFRQSTFLHQAIQDGSCYHTFTEFVDKAHRSRRIRGKTVGLIGMGNIGLAFCYRAKAFGFNVLVYDPYLRTGVSNATGIKQVDSLEELISSSDCISLHCPLTKETENIINEESLKLFKSDAFLINVSRGGQIDEVALAKALKDGRIAGAALDVQCVEPFKLKGSPFEGVPNLILTPHAGWYSKESYEDVRRGAAKAAYVAIAFTDHTKLKDCLNSRSINKEACCARW